MSFFSVDGPVFQFMRRLLDVLIINFCFLICCIPIVTIGPATVAAYTVTLKMVDEEEGYVGRQFFRAFKANFKNGLPIGILFLIAIYAMYLDVQLVATGLQPFMFLAITLISGAVFIAAFMYAFALSARYENTFINTIRNSYKIFVRHFLKSLALLAVVAFEVLIFTFSTTTIFFGILIGPTCIIYTISGMALPIFRQIEADGGVVKKEEAEVNKEAVFVDHEESDIARKAHMNGKK